MISESEDPEFVHKRLKFRYVDVIISGDSDDIGVYKLYVKIKSRLANGGFNARKFPSNSKEIYEPDQGKREIVRKRLPWRSIHCVKGKF